METARTTTYEMKHVRCGVEDVQAVINQHQLFFWDANGTNTIVSRDSHLESGGVFDSDSIYSVTVEERFSTIDFKRAKNIPRLQEIKSVEQQYFAIVKQLEDLGCSARDDYSSPPPKSFSWATFLLLCMPTAFIGGILYWINKNKKYQELCNTWRSTKSRLDSTIEQNRQLLSS